MALGEIVRPVCNGRPRRGRGTVGRGKRWGRTRAARHETPEPQTKALGDHNKDRGTEPRRVEMVLSLLACWLKWSSTRLFECSSWR